jgi:hypothetical protein
MKPFLDDAVASARLTAASFNIRTVAAIVCIAALLFIAVYAMTVNPNDAAATIAIPP